MALLKGHWQLLLLTTLVFALWQTPVVVPLKILIVFFHEASHAIATILTGGKVLSLSISANQGGEVWSQGGNRFITLTASYLGSLLIGIGLLIAATRTTADRAIMGGCGVITLLIAAFYIRDLFALGFIVGTGGAMLLIARFLGHAANDMALRVMGLASIIYVPYDIFSDTIARSNLRSDAYMLAEEFGGTTVMWGGTWLALSVIVIVCCLRYGPGRSSNLAFRRPQT